MKAFWFVFLTIFIFAAIAIFKQDTIKEKTGVNDPDSRINKAIGDSLGLNRIKYVDRAKNVGTKVEFHGIKTAFVMYYTMYNEYPKKLEDLVEKRYLGQDALSDFWKQGYRTDLDGKDLILTSPGPDRIKNTKDDINERIPLM